MSASKLEFDIIADNEDEKARSGKVPAFSIGDNDYFHGDTFVMPSRWAMNMDNFKGNGVRFLVPYQLKDEATGEFSTEYRNMILPVRLKDGQEVPPLAPPQEPADESSSDAGQKTPKKSAGKKAK